MAQNTAAPSISIQGKFERIAGERAKKLGFEAVYDRSYSNTGSVHFQPSDGFDTVLTVTFNFQTGSSSFSSPQQVFDTPQVPALGGGTRASVSGDPSKLNDVLGAITDFLAAQPSAKAA